MIKVTQEASKKRITDDASGLTKLEALRQKINNDVYLHEAIQRIALIMSNALLDLPQGGRTYEQQRKSRQWPRK
jgi:hypothetical protein